MWLHPVVVKANELVRCRPADQHGADLFGLLGREEKISAGGLLDAVHAHTGLHDSARRVGIVGEHQVAGLMGNHLTEN